MKNLKPCKFKRMQFRDSSQRPTSSFWITLNCAKEDHQDDMEFIRYNSSVMSVIEHISFTVAERINFHLDSNSVTAYFTHLTFHLSPNIQHLAFEYELHVYSNSSYISHALYFPLLVLALNHLSHYYSVLIMCDRGERCVNSAAWRCLCLKVSCTPITCRKRMVNFPSLFTANMCSTVHVVWPLKHV